MRQFTAEHCQAIKDGMLAHRDADPDAWRRRNKRIRASMKRYWRQRMGRLARAHFLTGASIAETCWINRKTMPASEISRRLRITRNAVIGHWFRWKSKLAKAERELT